MSQLPGHPWYRVLAENPCHRRPRLGVFIFGIPVTCGVFVNRCGGALVSCFGFAGGIPLLCPAQEGVKMTRTAVGSRHPRTGRSGARRV